VSKQSGTGHVLYLLHFPEEVSGARHYLGITTPSNLRTRLRKHLGGFGAGLTARAAAQCSHFVLVALWSRASYDFERSVKNRGHLKTYCKLCSKMDRKRQRHIHHLSVVLSIPKAVEAQGLSARPLSW
jgi:predicted GIY-YIG superfamily endonuclease